MRAAVAYNTVNIGVDGKVPLGTLPAGAIITYALVKINTPFNAATTNVLTVGTATSNAAVLTAADINESVAGTTITWAAAGYKVTDATPLFVVYTQTGTAASAGAADIIIHFVPNNDR
jgi:carbon monoxide dehydrogenase subunit G